jgi:hypothetical protein
MRGPTDDELPEMAPLCRGSDYAELPRFRKYRVIVILSHSA